MPSRRAFLSAVAAAVACGRERSGPDPSLAPCTTTGDGAWDLLRGTFLGTRPLLDGEGRPMEETYGTGLAARRIVDLEALTPDGLVIPAERFYLRTGAPLDLDAPDPWEIRLGGRVAAEQVLGMDEIGQWVEEIGTLHLECSGNGDGARFGLMSAGRFAGVRFSRLLERTSPLSDATAVRVTGRDTHPPTSSSVQGAAWVFRPDELEEAWLVTHQDDAPIPVDHGAPARLLVPGWYGCTCIKWVEAVDWVGDDEPATSQMTEFALRTHQDGSPELARDFAPAESETAALPVRIEAWRVDGERLFRVIGAVFGGRRQPDALHLWMDGEDLGPVDLCPREHARTWGLWQTFLPQGASGVVRLRCTAVGVPARRLDAKYYARSVDLG